MKYCVVALLVCLSLNQVTAQTLVSDIRVDNLGSWDAGIQYAGKTGTAEWQVWLQANAQALCTSADILAGQNWALASPGQTSFGIHYGAFYLGTLAWQRDGIFLSHGAKALTEITATALGADKPLIGSDTQGSLKRWGVAWQSTGPLALILREQNNQGDWLLLGLGWQLDAGKTNQSYLRLIGWEQVQTGAPLASEDWQINTGLEPSSRFYGLMLSGLADLGSGWQCSGAMVLSDALGFEMASGGWLSITLPLAGPKDKGQNLKVAGVITSPDFILSAGEFPNEDALVSLDCSLKLSQDWTVQSVMNMWWVWEKNYYGKDNLVYADGSVTIDIGYKQGKNLFSLAGKADGTKWETDLQGGIGESSWSIELDIAGSGDWYLLKRLDASLNLGLNLEALRVSIESQLNWDKPLEDVSTLSLDLKAELACQYNELLGLKIALSYAPLLLSGPKNQDGTWHLALSLGFRSNRQ